MPHESAWHCTECNHYFQTEPSEPPPTACRWCGADASDLVRIDHPRDRATGVDVGDTVTADIHGHVETVVVGRVRAVAGDRILVDASDGTGRYVVTPDQVVHVRERVAG